MANKLPTYSGLFASYTSFFSYFQEWVGIGRRDHGGTAFASTPTICKKHLKVIQPFNNVIQPSF